MSNDDSVNILLIDGIDKADSTTHSDSPLSHQIIKSLKRRMDGSGSEKTVRSARPALGHPKSNMARVVHELDKESAS